MIPGEEVIYDYIVDKNVYYATLNIQVEVTLTVLNECAKKEMERLKNIESEIMKDIFKKLGSSPLIERYGSANPSGVFASLFNDIFNGIQYQCCSQGQWRIDPINGKGFGIPYHEFDSSLGISKDVAKDCLKRLMDKGKVSRKRGIGGYEYLIPPNRLAKAMMESPGEWKPVHFNPSTMLFEEDKTMWALVQEAQKDLEPIQDYYERRVKETCDNTTP